MAARSMLAALTALLLALTTAHPAGAGDAAAGPFAGRRILWVDSYHQGYEWSDGTERGIRETLRGSGAELAVFRLDTKRNPDENFARQAGLKAKAAIDRLRPDVVLASDDNAQKFLVVPFLKNSALPVVFCGVNWDASVYGYPTPNVTGMVEVDLVDESRGMLRDLAKGDRVAFVSPDTETQRKISAHYNARFFDGRMRTFLARSFAEFTARFLEAQAAADMVILYNNAGLPDWDPETAEAFFLANTRVPTVTYVDWMAPYAVFCFAHLPEEQGEHAARTALRILGGEKPADIPLVENRRARLMVNLRLAQAAGVTVPLSVLKTAEVLGRAPAPWP